MDKSSSVISRDQIDSDNSNTLAKACRPRYSVKDSSVECLPQKQLNLATPRLFSICSISRKRISICFMIVLLYFAIKTHFKEKNMLLKQITADNIQGYTESDGFFKDVPQSRWKLWKQRVQEMRSKQNKLNKKITCPHSQRVNSKWICDPNNIPITSNEREGSDKNGCLIYTSYAQLNDYTFETELLKIIGKCDIHVFCPNPQTSPKVTVPQGVIFHQWGFKGSKAGTQNDLNYKTIQETVLELSHEGKIVDVLMIDCEGCEYDIVQDLFDKSDTYIGPTFMQILVQMHSVAPTPIINNFISSVQDNGYVIFYKEAKGNGREREYSFLKLAPHYFEKPI